MKTVFAKSQRTLPDSDLMKKIDRNSARPHPKIVITRPTTFWFILIVTVKKLYISPISTDAANAVSSVSRMTITTLGFATALQ